ncbi:YdbL family protein [Marinobacter sp. BGYM27]|uniref:YdbL family protein n=1 Tax=unclassified Marinobacter TaxID=83889 RepID=UPI0021A92D21|nr:YdbL family protein [Marinobacter sp. BGYM27]MDG5501290.1 YdbL family protein [Marinobacter sp. BGYM27]
MTRFARISALFIALCLSLPALGMGLDEAKGKLESAKTQGLIGETPTGYLETVKADSQAQAIVDAINKARRDEYARIAEKHDIAVTKVETVAGQKAIEKTPTGQYIQQDGNWVKK